MSLLLKLYSFWSPSCLPCDQVASSIHFLTIISPLFLDLSLVFVASHKLFPPVASLPFRLAASVKIELRKRFDIEEESRQLKRKGGAGVVVEYEKEREREE